ncbi:hypothetical protein DSO57_1031757 [Entomophthora muscae]|uniref:Uncharacterized protein n=1 Tax=Entomophthora muscae TaxID=34485 RepID=A0ACC2UA32_9FUNG|nr:hypothetical protein DSO57_1031757 [Entomophthora muscae]
MEDLGAEIKTLQTAVASPAASSPPHKGEEFFPGKGGQPCINFSTLTAKLNWGIDILDHDYEWLNTQIEGIWATTAAQQIQINGALQLTAATREVSIQ